MRTFNEQHRRDAHITSSMSAATKKFKTFSLLACLLFFLIAFTQQNAIAETTSTPQTTDTLLLSSGINGSFPLQAHVTYYDPGIQQPDLADVIQIPISHWQTLEQKPAGMLLHPRHALWYRLQIKNDTHDAQRLFLHDSNPLTDNMIASICLQPDNAHSCNQANKHQYNKNLQTFTLNQDQSVTLLIQTTGFHSNFFTLSLLNPTAFTWQQYRQRIYYGLLDGILCGLAFYSLILAIKIRQKAYFAYYIFGSCLSGTFFIHQDFFHTFFGHTPNTWLTNLSIIMPLIDGGSLAYFLGHYLYPDKIPKSVSLFLKVYLSVIVGIIIAFLCDAPTIFIAPLYGIFSIFGIPYFIYLFFKQNNQSHLGITLLCIGLSLPFFNCITTLLAATGVIAAADNFIAVMQTIETISASLFAVAILISVKHIQVEGEKQERLATEAGITSTVHSNLLSHLNHELRTPLNGILGAAEILMHKSHLPKDRRVFSMIYHTALPLKHLIEDMVNVKSIKKNQKELQNTRFDLHNLLQECMDIFLLMAHDRKIRLYFQIDNNVTSDITADANRLRQMLINLIGNACKFTSDGVVGLHVRRESSLSAHEHIYCFEVIDSGQGINDDDEKRLFQIFESGHVESNPKGTGVGLSIVRELSHLMGGNCGYKKNVEIGSTFWFSIAVTTHHNISRKAHGAYDRLKIILADPNANIVNSLAQKVAGAAKSVTTAHTPQQVAYAIQEATQEAQDTGIKPADLVVLHTQFVTENVLHAILAMNIPLIVYEDYDEISGNERNLGAKNDYETIVRKPSIETFSLNIAEAIIKKDNISHIKHSKLPERYNTILVAEDIPTNQLIIEEILKSINLKPVTCDNGKKTFEMYCQHYQQGKPFPIIIMDCEMPIMDGFEATEKIRAYEGDNEIPASLIIALSAHAEPEYRLRSKRSGMNLYLTKPVSADTLIQHIENHRRSLV